jgi:hypothetical protein
VLTPPDVADLTTLLRVLAGRIADGQLADRRADLAARDLWELQLNLLGYLAEHAIPLRDEEIALLPEARAKPDGIRIRKLTRLRETDPLPGYRFEPLDADGSPAERYVLERAARHPALRRVRKALRIPANEAAIDRETVVYVAECTPDGEVYRLQDALDVSRYGEQTEVVAEGEELPPYQAAALAAGRLIWTRD